MRIQGRKTFFSTGKWSYKEEVVHKQKTELKDRIVNAKEKRYKNRKMKTEKKNCIQM